MNTGGRALRFGICTDQNLPFETLVERWQWFEELGFDSIWDCDHFNQPSRPDGPYFEGWTLLAALAARTRRIRVGVLVSSNTFRHPALVAQAATTVDHISHGRLELGFGAGWFAAEHRRYGLAFPPAKERVERFAEAVEVVDGLLRNGTVTFAGRYYQLEAAYVRPRPVQRPRPPLTLGAHGSKMLAVCARYADVWNSFGSVDDIGSRSSLLDEHCAAIGRDPGEIRRSFYGWASEMEDQGLPDPWESVGAFEDVVGRYAEAGIEEFILDQPDPSRSAMVERIVAEALPRLRGAPGA